jgi:hypothetical protein
MATPYTYILKHKPTGRIYFGARWAKNCNPDDLFVTYFSSSKTIKKIIKEEGTDVFMYRVIETFTCPEDCVSKEYAVLQKYKAGRNPRFINLSHSISQAWTREMKAKASRSHKDRVATGTHPTAFKPGHAPTKGFTGRKHTEESRKLMGLKGDSNPSCRPEVKEMRRAQFLKDNPAKKPSVRKKMLKKAQERAALQCSCLLCGKQMSVCGMPSHYKVHKGQ